jgi:hypothetical protein
MLYVDIGEMTGKAYNLSHRMARESQHGIYDSDPIAFGNAYRDTLDFAKHGNKVEFPSHLQLDFQRIYTSIYPHPITHVDQ